MNKQIYLALALILSTCFGLVGCYRDCPDDGGDPNKEDTIPMGEYTPIYELDADGNLKHLPIPFVDFMAGELPLKKWEAAHGAMLQKEVVADFKGQQVKNLPRPPAAGGASPASGPTGSRSRGRRR